jgi:hypothetical protein
LPKRIVTIQASSLLDSSTPAALRSSFLKGGGFGSPGLPNPSPFRKKNTKILDQIDNLLLKIDYSE